MAKEINKLQSPPMGVGSGADQLARFIDQHQRIVVLTGAGISLSSGIPTYRNSKGEWKCSQPIQHRDFIQSPQQRKRYWAGSMAGWPKVRDARPNAAHQSLADLERRGKIEKLITQNVDRLHQRAGSKSTIDLHGRLDRVRCLECSTICSRQLIQHQMIRANSSLNETAIRSGPDGDSEVSSGYISAFITPDCQNCSGVLMPDVVFFGGTVPRERTQSCYDALSRADGLLAIGSSLQVYSGFRFVRRAYEQKLPIAIINPGVTRADNLASIKLELACEPLLAAVVMKP